MLRKIYGFCLALSLVSFMPHSYAQTDKSEIAVGYGYYSIFSFINRGMNQGVPYTTSSGTFTATYRYYVSKQVTLGLGIGYENISSWGSFVSFVPEVTVAYLDTRDSYIRVRLYGTVAAGVTIFDDLNVQSGYATESGLKPWAFQADPLCLRIGRQVAWYAEIGLGYKGLVNTGIEIRVPRYLQHNHSKLKPSSNN